MKGIIAILTFILFCCRPESSKEAVVASAGMASEQGATAQDDFRIYHDPSSTRFRIKFTGTTTGKGLVNVYAADVKLISRTQVNVNKGINTWELQLPSRTSGIYWVKFIIDKTERIAKMVKVFSKSTKGNNNEQED